MKLIKKQKKNTHLDFTVLPCGKRCKNLEIVFTEISEKEAKKLNPYGQSISELLQEYRSVRSNVVVTASTNTVPTQTAYAVRRDE